LILFAAIRNFETTGDNGREAAHPKEKGQSADNDEQFILSAAIARVHIPLIHTSVPVNLAQSVVALSRKVKCGLKYVIQTSITIEVPLRLSSPQVVLSELLECLSRL
jgi:hypothetical protein